MILRLGFEHGVKIIFTFFTNIVCKKNKAICAFLFKVATCTFSLESFYDSIGVQIYKICFTVLQYFISPWLSARVSSVLMWSNRDDHEVVLLAGLHIFYCKNEDFFFK